MFGLSKKYILISRRCAVLVAVALIVVFSSSVAESARLKDIAFFEGVRSNQLIGYGIVVGLEGTGDKSGAVYTNQSVANMLNKIGMKIDPGSLSIKNTAAVIVTAELPPFSKKGSRIDVLVSSIGDAKSLQGGTLLVTPLKSHDGKVYAVAQGPVSMGGFVAGIGGTTISKNHQTVAKVPGGAFIEKEVPFSLAGKRSLSLIFRHPDFTTAKSAADEINMILGGTMAVALDGGSVAIRIPAEYKNDIVTFIAKVEKLTINEDTISRVVVNERTGTVVMGKNVTISTVAVSHGDITIQINTDTDVSQPGAFSRGQTVVTESQDIQVFEKPASLMLIKQTITLGEVVSALNEVGVTPRDLVAILQALKAAGALQAELVII
jgi:flagellar P-ring protein precursor FlgI